MSYLIRMGNDKYNETVDYYILIVTISTSKTILYMLCIIIYTG